MADALAGFDMGLEVDHTPHIGPPAVGSTAVARKRLIQRKEFIGSSYDMTGGHVAMLTDEANAAVTGMEFADAICARICHDLSSPLGTLMGALEMAVDDPDSAADALPVANDAASAMGHRLRLLRAAWAGDCGEMTRRELAQLAEGLPGRVRVNLDALQAGPFNPAWSRVLVNLLLLGADALPRGGVVSIAGAPPAEVRVSVAGVAAAWPAELQPALRDPASVPLDSPRAVQAPIAVMLARAAGLRLAMGIAPGPLPHTASLVLSLA
jgi:histidine phosphotransferase ChpT